MAEGKNDYFKCELRELEGENPIAEVWVREMSGDSLSKGIIIIIIIIIIITRGIIFQIHSLLSKILPVRDPEVGREDGCLRCRGLSSGSKVTERP